MEPARSHSGSCAINGLHMPNLADMEESNNNINPATTRYQIDPSHTALYGPHPFIKNDDLSPPRERRVEQRNAVAIPASSQGQSGLGSSLFRTSTCNHPPTPPTYDDDLDVLRRWNAGFSTPAAPDYNALSSSGETLRPPDHVMAHQSHLGALPTQLHSHPRTFEPESLDGLPDLSDMTESGRMHGYGGFQSTPFLPSMHTAGQVNDEFLENIRRTFPSAAYLFELSQAAPQSSQTQYALPPIQQWPTHNLTRQYTSHRVRESLPSNQLLTPKRDRTSLPDKKTLTKQEVYQRKGEEARHRRESFLSKQREATKTPRNRPGRTRTKRKRPAPTDVTHDPVAPSSPLDSRLASYYTQMQQTQDASSLRSLQTSSTGNDVYDGEHQLGHAPSMYAQSTNDGVLISDVDVVIPFEWEMLPQSIATSYEEYKWSVQLYQLTPKTTMYYDFAQAWLSDLIENYVKSGQWFTHSTQGFIKHGTRTNFLVLHNAANPFRWGEPPDCTTTIGVYGSHWYTHSDIHWITYAPGIRSILQQCVDDGWISEQMKWKVDDKPSEKRFHRAYWLAANRLALKGLLNHTETLRDEPHDAVAEEIDDKFELSEEHLTNEWDTTEDEAMVKWDEILQEVNGPEDIPETGYDHVVTGSSEWK